MRLCRTLTSAPAISDPRFAGDLRRTLQQRGLDDVRCLALVNKQNTSIAVGVAVGQAYLGTARPIATLSYEANAHRFAAIEKLIAEWHPDLLVVGLPFSNDGKEHEMSARCRRFAK